MVSASRLSITAAVAVAVVAYIGYGRLPHVERLARARAHAAAANGTTSHAYHVFHDLFDEAQVAELLRDVLRGGGALRMTTAAYTEAAVDNIGESVPTEADGSCAAAFLTPTRDGKRCIFPERLDVARHQIFTGGIDALKESYATAVSRLIMFQRYYHGMEGAIDAAPAAVRGLFHSDAYRREAAKVCGADRPVREPMTLAVIVSLPGQMVAMHGDLPYFADADRYDLPGWLLVVMQMSGVFRERRVPQVQGVYYLHRYNTTARRGGFYFYQRGNAAPPLVVPAEHNSAVICDGTEMVHGTQTYMREAGRTPVSKDGLWEIRAVGGGGGDGDGDGGDDPWWSLTRDGVEVRRYRESELRITLVWREHCFRDEAERDAIKARAVQPRLTPADVLPRLAAELRRRGRLGADEQLPADPQRTAELLIDEFIAYPFPPDALVPYNPCALEVLAPDALKPLFHAVCP